MSRPENTDDLLQSALSTAFTPVSIAPEPPSDAPIAPPNAAPAPAPEPAPSPPTSQEERNKWEEERRRWEEESAAIEQSWREQSAVERREAEERRARIAAERVATGETWEKLDQEQPPRGPPNPLFGISGSSSLPEAGPSAAGEPTGSSAHALEASQVSSHVFSHATTPERVQPWEEVEGVLSMESSYPSLSFPEQSDSTSPDLPSRYRISTRATGDARAGSGRVPVSAAAAAAAAGAVAPPSATLSIFDSRLPARARALALISSLSINFLLPFVNGVMLGFGEIFARSLASRFGWKVPGGAAAAVGIGASVASKRRWFGS
ncbi:hypothetical protein M0805_001364 [Coniferiporia weirii]|nr:hypothetical protein M0805_001364 [Coniferiporia weirii]